MTLDKLLPIKFQNVGAWKDLADVFESKIFSPNLDSFNRIKALREVTQADADQLHHIKELLGIPISIDGFVESEKRRLLELITFWYEKSGTKFFIDLLRFVKNADVELFELFNNIDVVDEVIGSGDNSIVDFTGNLDKLPVDNVLGNVIITDGSQVLTDDQAGSFTGDGSGTIDYTTGAYDITFNSTPPTGTDNITCDYYTHEYQEFVKDFEVTAPFTKDGGTAYLTNHVGLLFDLEVFDPSNIVSLFYQIASTVLVLRVLEGLIKGINPLAMQYTGEGHLQTDVKLLTSINHEFRNIVDYSRNIDALNDKFNTIGLEPSDEFEPALITTPDIVIPRHLYTIGDPLAATVVIGTPLAGNVDSLSPSIEEANFELPVFDSLQSQEIFRSTGSLVETAVTDSEILNVRVLVVGSLDLDGLLVGDVYWDFIDVDDTRETFDGTVSNPLVIPINPNSLVVTDGTETFTDDGLGNLIGSLGGDGFVDYPSGRIIARFITPPISIVAATFSGGITELSTSYRPVENNFNWRVGQPDLTTLVVGDKNLDRLHGGQIDIDYIRTEPIGTSQHLDDYLNWSQNIIFGGPRLSSSLTHLPHGIDSVDALSQIQVRYSILSNSGPWSIWEPLIGSNFTGRWLQFRLHYERPPASFATSLLTEARHQVDVRDKREVLVRQFIPVTGFTFNFDNNYFIIPATTFIHDSSLKAIIDSKDENQVTFHLENSSGIIVASESSVDVRGY